MPVTRSRVTLTTYVGGNVTSGRAVPSRAVRYLLAACVALAALTLLVPSAPTYDPWAWLIWGREIAHGDLSTAGGPAWKPLPVAVTAALSPFGGAAPDAWLIVARAGALLALASAFLLGRRLAGGSAAAGAGAAVAVLLCERFAWHGAVGNAEGLLLALGLLAGERVLAGHARQALALGFGAALLRPEAWPFFGALALWVAARDRGARPLVAGLALAVPLLWIVPEWIASGDPWRSSERARIPNPGAPALADFPALESLRRAATIPPLPALVAAALTLAAAARHGRARAREPGPAAHAARLSWPALAGLAWIALVAAMSQAGYSGEERYLLPGAALVALSGGAALGLALAPRELSCLSRDIRGQVHTVAGYGRFAAVALLAAVALAAPFAVARGRDVVADLRASAREARLFDALGGAVAAAGGRVAVLRCGRPYTGPLRGPAVAWHLRVAKSRVGFAPRAPGVAFVSRLPGRRAAEPAVAAGFAPVARHGGWNVVRACGADV